MSTRPLTETPDSRKIRRKTAIYHSPPRANRQPSVPSFPLQCHNQPINTYKGPTDDDRRSQPSNDQSTSAYHSPPLREQVPAGPLNTGNQPLHPVGGVYIPPPPPPVEFNDLPSSPNDARPPLSGRSGKKQKQSGAFGALRSCPECGDPSHGYRLCPYNDETARKECYEEAQHFSSEQAVPARSCYVPATESAYLRGSLFGKNTYILLDSGSKAN